MGITAQPDGPAFISALQNAIRGECEKIVAEEAERAAQRVRERLADLTPRMVMKLSQHFEVHAEGQRIVIEVRKFEPEGKQA